MPIPTPSAPPAVIVTNLGPPSGGDWAFLGSEAPNVLPSSANAGLDQSVHQMTPYGDFPAVINWIDNFAAHLNPGQRLYYVGVWGSPSLGEYQIIVAVDQ